MPTTLNSGLQLPDKGSVDWYSSMQTNYGLLDNHLENTDIHVTAEDKANWNSKQGSLSQAQLDAIAQVSTNTSDITALQSGKANASHTHSSSDITDIGDYATKQYVDNSISGLVDNAPDALNTLNELSAALNDDSNFATTVTNALAAKANSADLATIATSGSYNDLSNKPTINDSTITIQKNGTLVGTFTVNGSAKTIDIPVPTKTSDLTNDSNFVDTSNSAVASGITSAKVTSYDSHIADTDIHVTTADKTKWNNGVSQSYVLRYSSSSVTDNSTIAYSTLDNTDNIKASDKVIDVDGKIFSIVSVDTANQTVTVGTALVDLALDANVVHTSGNETISGEKTFNDLQIISYGTQYKGARNAYILPEFSAGYSGLSITTLSYSQTLKIGSFVLDSNNKPTLDTSKAYIQIATGENNSVNTCVLEPRNSTNSLLGTSANNWKGVYATNYYYGANNVEFSTKFVTTDTNQTISGQKTFSDRIIINNNTATIQDDVPYLLLKNPLVERASTTLEGFQQIRFVDKNANNIGTISAQTYTSGTSDIILTSYSQDGDATRTTGVVIRRSPTASKFHPYFDNVTALGETNRRWSRVYGTEYYYGSNNVEFSTKFVTTDTAQTISGDKSFSSDLRVANIDTTANTPNLNLRNYKADRGTTDTAVQAISFLDKNAKALTSIESRRISNGNTATNILCYNTDDSNNTVSGGVAIIKNKTDTNFAPNADNAVTCGRALARWSDVQTYKVNGLTPSSLSLPEFSKRVDIAGYISNLTGGTNNYTPSVNGWLYVGSNDASYLALFDTGSGGCGIRFSDGVVGEKYACIPCQANRTLGVKITCTNLAHAYFIPCQGNI